MSTAPISALTSELQDSFRPDTETYVLCTLLRYRAQYWSSPYACKYLPNQLLVFSQASWAASG
jgi:hypothetical protein